MSDIKWTKKAAEHIDGYRLLEKARVEDINSLAEALGYDGVEEFFRDNPGAYEGVQDFVIEWIESGRGTEYVKSLKKFITENLGEEVEEKIEEVPEEKEGV